MSNGLSFVLSDGGRSLAGFSTQRQVGDCVCRSIAVVSGCPYHEIYDGLWRELDRHERRSGTPTRGRGRRYSGFTPRNGLPRQIYGPYLERELHWRWTRAEPGCRLVPGDVPNVGSHVIALARHMTAIIDGVVYDSWNCATNGARLRVYGWWTPSGEWLYDKGEIMRVADAMLRTQ